MLSGVMLGVPVYMIELYQPGFWLFLPMLLAAYPLLTGIIGVDPLYNSLNIRTCDTSRRNQCGTFPYEVDAALGRNPIPQNDVEHSLEHSRHLA
jgi:hypothetical protein